MDKKTTATDSLQSAIDRLPGAAIDIADDKTVDPALVKERTRTLNDNPRDNNIDQ